MLAGMRGAFITGLLALALAGGACQSDEEATPSTSPTPAVTGKGPRSPTSTEVAEITPTPLKTPNADPILRLVDEVLYPDLTRRIAINREELDIEVVSAEEHQWRDRCLGLAPPESCPLPVEPVSGYRITLEAKGDQYIYHASRQGWYLFGGTPDGLQVVIERAKYYLVHERGITGQIETVAVEEVIWGLCGVPYDGGACSSTSAGPGYRITLRDAAQEFVFHTDRINSTRYIGPN